MPRPGHVLYSLSHAVRGLHLNWYIIRIRHVFPYIQYVSAETLHLNWCTLRIQHIFAYMCLPRSMYNMSWRQSSVHCVQRGTHTYAPSTSKASLFSSTIKHWHCWFISVLLNAGARIHAVEKPIRFRTHGPHKWCGRLLFLSWFREGVTNISVYNLKLSKIPEIYFNDKNISQRMLLQLFLFLSQ